MSAPKKIIALFLDLAFIASLGYGQNHCLISQDDAEKILGRPAHPSANSSEKKNNVVKYRCTFTANDQRVTPDKESNLYYLLEEYSNAGDAEKSFKLIISENEGMPGLQPLPGFGDEAIIQSDSLHFQLIIVRKKDRMLRMKVNKVTPTTSLNELKLITKRISDQL